jgi:imidazolonepropionase-like amidohydrolase
MAGYRAAFIEAERYRDKWDRWLRDHKGNPPDRDLKLETLAEVLRGHILPHIHCYRADEMAQMIDLSKEFGFKIRSFHHAVEGYKIADVRAREGIAASVWDDWWGFKMEALDGIPENAALLERAGARPIMHSDDPGVIQRLNQEAAKAMYAGRRIGINITREQAIRWITANPAWALGIDSTTGTLERGKAADVVVWSGDPFSVYARAEKVYNDGWLLFDRADTTKQWKTDFNLGTAAPGVGR